MEYSTNWIWTRDWKEHKKTEAVIVYFRKEFQQAETIRILANCRYKLYVNGIFVQEGPQKGSVQSAYLDSADIREYMVAGEKNAIAIEVLYYPVDPEKRNDSLYYSPFPCLFVEDESGHELDGRSGYRYHYADGITVTGEPFFPAPIYGCEQVLGQGALVGWKKVGYDDSAWEEACPYNFFETRKALAPFDFENRTIPPMKHEDRFFDEVVCVRACGRENPKTLSKAWGDFVKGRKPLFIKANQKQIIELSAGEEMCGYPCISFAQGRNARVRITYSECYANTQADIVTPMGSRPAPLLKGDRCDWENAILTGPSDSYLVSGLGRKENREVYEPFLFRTFRFIQIEIETKEESLEILDFYFRSTGYPLEVKKHPISKRQDYNDIWDISLRTLKRCMHETYVDCPFYEQLQYTMDSRAEILFTYEISGDDRLARNCMESFRRTQRHDGMIQASAPAVGVNVIPGFSVFYIMMVHDHMKYFSDRDLVKKHFTCIDGILHYFEDHMTKKGLVGSVGGVLFQHRYWSFVDWCQEWDDTIGVPTAATKGDRSITMESLLYIHGLRCAAELAEFIGRDCVAEEYRTRAMRVAEAVRRFCISEEGLIQDGPGINEYSTHCQVWGILTDLVDEEQGRINLQKTYRVEGIPQPSVSMSFYLFLAFEKLDMLDSKELDFMWDPWRDMLKNHLTTCVENTTDGRSDCHAWGAIMLYALPRLISCEKL